MNHPVNSAVKPESGAKSSRLKIVIIILAVLLVLSAGSLAARYIYLNFFAPTQATVTVPDNLIGETASPRLAAPAASISTARLNSETAIFALGEPEKTTDKPGKPQAVKLELYQGQPGDNQKFEIRNMLPGDMETRYFCVKAYHDADITLFFQANVTEQTKSLGDVLHIKVTHLDSGKVLCDAPFAEINGQEFSELLDKNAQGETAAYYQIDVSLDTSVGNEYQAALLKADFEWYVKDEGGLTPPPQTGDTTNIILWMTLALSSLLLMFLLLLGRRRKEEQHG